MAEEKNWWRPFETKLLAPTVLLASLAGVLSIPQSAAQVTPAPTSRAGLKEVVCEAFLPAHRALHARVETDLSILLLDVLAIEETGDPVLGIPAGRGPAFKAGLSALGRLSSPLAAEVKKGVQTKQILRKAKGSLPDLVTVAATAQKKFDSGLQTLPAPEQQAVRHLYLLQEMPHFPPLPGPGSGGSTLENLLISFVTEHVAKHGVLTQQATLALLQAIEEVKRPASRKLLLKVLGEVNPQAAQEVVSGQGKTALKTFRDEEASVLSRHQEKKAAVAATHQGLAPDQQAATACLVS